MKISRGPKTLIFIWVILPFASIVISQFLSKEPIDLSEEEAPFPSIKMPPQAVYGFGYIDGGSIGILIVDRLGAKHEFTFPIDSNGIRNAHPTAFIGDFNGRTMIAMKNPGRAKEIVIYLLDQFGKDKESLGPDSQGHTARARRDLASPLGVVAIRLFEKAKRTLGY